MHHEIRTVGDLCDLLAKVREATERAEGTMGLQREWALQEYAALMGEVVEFAPLEIGHD